jgi:DNA-binding beta-propeller fold protein YncE
MNGNVSERSKKCVRRRFRVGLVSYALAVTSLVYACGDGRANSGAPDFGVQSDHGFSVDAAPDLAPAGDVGVGSVIDLSGQADFGRADGPDERSKEPINLNYEILGQQTPNVLKGMMVAVDSDQHLGFVAGIMTNTVGIVDLTANRFIGAFAVSDATLNVAKMAYDGIHKRLWLVSGRGAYIKIVDPETRSVVAEIDTTGEAGPQTPDYPVRAIALDAERQTVYLIRRDQTTRILAYDNTLSPPREVLSDESVFSIRWDTENDRLIVLTAPRMGAGEILLLPRGDASLLTRIAAPAGSRRPPHLITADDEGHLFVAGESLWKIETATGTEKFRVMLPFQAAHIEVAGDEVGVLEKTALQPSEDDYVSKLHTFSVATGALIASRPAGLESSRMAAISGGGFLVGNAGGAEVLNFPVGASPGQTIDVGTAAEDIHFSRDGDRVFVLNRLGGSQLLEKSLITGETRILGEDAIGAWPIRMATRMDEDKAFVLGHFESKLTVIGLSDLKKLRTIDLGQGHALTDTMSDLVADPAGRLLVALLAEQGKVVIVDGSTEDVLAVVELGPEVLGGGPGRMNAAVDADTRAVYVYLADDATLYKLEESNGFQVDPTAKVELTFSRDVQQSYGFGAVYFNVRQSRVFVWNQAVNSRTLDHGPALPNIHRVVGERDGTIYAERKTPGGDEILVALDDETLEETGQLVIGNYRAMGSQTAFHWETGLLAQALGAQSEVHFFELSAL